MNPLPMIIADLKALRWTGLAVVALVALAVSIGVTISAQERSLRRSATVAADDFDLLVGAPGSQTQLMLATVFLQPDATALMGGDVLARLSADARVRAVAPIAPGDVADGYPIVGTNADFATRWGRLPPAAGRMFAMAGEAVTGADVPFVLGAVIVPSHAVSGARRPFGVAYGDEAEHRHEGHSYTVVGRLPRLGTPWDRAILVPIESVWATHGLTPPARPSAGDGAGTARAPGAFAAGNDLPGVPAIVVRPRSIADAYALRGAYRQGGTMAFFPAEVLVSLYGLMGDVRDVLVAASFLNAILIFAAILLLLWAIAGLRRRRYAILRALGAPRRYILLVVWLNALVLLAGGSALGLLLGWALAGFAARYLASATGLDPAFVFSAGDMGPVAALIVIASLLSLIPALVSSTTPIVDGLRQN